MGTMSFNAQRAYSSRRWQRLRERQLKREPLCRMCEAEGLYLPATVCDHIVPHKGNPTAFWSGPFQSLCKRHHDSDKAMIEHGKRPRQAIGIDGWPIIEQAERRGAWPKAG